MILSGGFFIRSNDNVKMNFYNDILRLTSTFISFFHTFQSLSIVRFLQVNDDDKSTLKWKSQFLFDKHDSQKFF